LCMRTVAKSIQAAPESKNRTPALDRLG
jgi:hypothetical protein